MKILIVILLLFGFSQLFSLEFVLKTKQTINGELMGISDNFIYAELKSGPMVVMEKSSVKSVYNGSINLTDYIMQRDNFFEHDLYSPIEIPDSLLIIPNELNQTVRQESIKRELRDINGSIKSVAAPLWISLIASIVASLVVVSSNK